MSEVHQIGFIGGGNMAESIVGGLCNAGVDPDSIVVSDPSQARRRHLAQKFGITATADNHDPARAATCILAVKPQVMQTVLLDLATDRGNSPALLVSIAAGITLECIDRWAGGNNAVVRAMPNTPALVGCGATALVANARTTVEQRRVAEEVMSTAGITAWLDDESQMDVITALSGSGPAYFFLIMDALADAAVEFGLDAELARRFTVQTALGAATLAMSSAEQSLERLRLNVTSPGGTTESGIQSMHESGVAAAMKLALQAARQRSIELAKHLGDDE